jgi:ammonium transporter, Amt family
LKYDDALDAFGVHGVGGTVGAVLTGVFASRACWDVSEGTPIGLIESGGNPTLLIGQIAAVGVTFVFAGVGSLILLKLIDMIIGLRVPPKANNVAWTCPITVKKATCSAKTDAVRKRFKNGR